MKVLFITNQVKAYNTGFQNDFEPLLSLKHEIFWAANFNGFLDNFESVPAKIINLPISSHPFARGNYKSYKALIKIVLKNKIDVILCSTPIGGFLGRLVAKKTKTKVIYAAHGLLFYKGAPLLNNTIYKLQEKIMAKWTDVIITINNEDYVAMSRIKKKNGCKLYLVHGAGVDVDNRTFCDFDVNKKREELGISKESYLLTSIGFLNKNKNYKVVINSLPLLPQGINVQYIICGDGDEKNKLLSLSKKRGVASRIHFLGYRTDVLEIIKASDIIIVPSFREGVPRVVLESMNLNVPCIGSNTRGIRELIGLENSQMLCNPKCPKDFARAICNVIDNQQLCKSVLERNFKEAQKYTSDIVRKELYEIFKENI